MRWRLWLLSFSFAALGHGVTPAGAGPLRYAVVPLAPLAQCTQSYAASVTAALRTQLRRQGMVLVSPQAVRRALGRQGLRAGQGGSAAEWSAFGRRIGAERVLVGRLRIQAMVRAKGDVWELEAEQFDGTAPQSLGRFKRVTAFGRAHGAALLPAFVTRLLTHDPKTPALTMTEPTPMSAPPNAPREEGMAYVPAGEFIMGSERAEIDEEPRHVVFTDAYFVDVHEVTNAQYDRCVAVRRCQRATARGNRKLNAPTQPVAGVGYQDAADYCAFAGKRVLTEAEWEKAARGSDERIFPWGNEWDAQRVNMANANDGYTHTAPVGSFPAGVSVYGIHDMAGNVWEWTADVYDANYYRKSPKRNPRGPTARGNARAPCHARRLVDV